ncbi:Polyisoprenoid-binding protein YceI [Raineyella antarctica]|uniref:Polyisoprenoid-binding protein YceI n=1 Tax=Raineyella antarctica TaxID=1577474 RepID=A0A1G6GDA6_9ACTN|nr:YceI family protein [Raineyella antarctica]SDB79977.1 Polyisoprenoid-binding protein YceI [Raineyella antarctica]
MSDYDPSWDGEWVADPGHTTIGFTARHAMVAKVGGAFDDIEVTINANASAPEQSTVVVRIAAASINTRNAQRDEHLRSPDFLDVEQFPYITFTSTSIEEVDDMAFMVTGELTIRDVTKTVVVPVDFTGVAHDPFGQTRAGFEGKRRLNRRDFGLEWNVPLDTGGVLVSEKVELSFEISAIKSNPSPAEDQ